MHQCPHAGRGGGFGDDAGALHLDAAHVGEAANQIDDRAGAFDRALDAGPVAHIGGQELRLAERAQRPQEPRRLGPALGDAHAEAFAARQQLLDGVAADEPAATQHRDDRVLHACKSPITPAPLPTASFVDKGMARSLSAPPTPCPDGGIGRRTSFRCWRSQGRGGSSPLLGTRDPFADVRVCP
jgi:hypothetical protein